MISLETLYVLCRFFHFVVVMLMFGLSLFTAMLASGRFSVLMRERLRVGVSISTVLALITSIVWFIIQAGLMGDGWHDVYQFDIWLVVLGTAFGQVWKWQLLVAALAVACLFFFHTKTRNFLLLGCSVILLSSHAFIGHAAMHEGNIGLLLQANQIVHLLSAGYWFGGLWPFLLCLQFLRLKNTLNSNLYRDGTYSGYIVDKLSGESVAAMRKFSNYGHFAVFMVIITGIVSSIILIPDWPVFSTTISEYQSMLWLKIALVAGMVLLALINRYILVPRLNQKRRYEWLTMNSWLEIILGTSVLLCIAIFATEPPV
ncbi:copper homeostasis membrane protein CopD [Xenorhabdus bovienii]|uniref:copper homeostasis membrane protein CopD n=1 Tax=Xenorhabdus bovienii TaxID=40576 RepID=UPI0023B2843C|nr:copper homeostasis membrane protein CopD [Xenorhabdus bovienii]MDE9433913.1 copper homeostasis membrane protein CopD [Xenorhabdus bovienii]MDE9440067.1 copper homeostasis membrane protein CopD [Xenorhabdus bovienii]MDE9461465.1 copper homeostasis membrane protein CopD [Xenorhabdus bovienii]MDE9467766.1 copper homeostasis membrane protein CopD [Xenorhabdus bovienii]MDE9491520.1 copper homeostasis membrane protein CopD [Xenorhabdus bovienii]